MRLELIGKPEGCKLLRMTIELDGVPSTASRIRAISIRGDFFAIPEEAFDELERELAGISLGELGQKFNALAREKNLECAGISGRGLNEIVLKELEHGL